MGSEMCIRDRDSFEVENKQPKRTVYHPSRREREITNIRKELRI